MKQYSREFKEEALKLSDEIGVKNAAKQLGVAYYTLADWRSIRWNRPPAKALSAEEQGIRIRELEREVSERTLPRCNARTASCMFPRSWTAVRSPRTSCRASRFGRSFSAMFSPATIASGSIRAIRLVCRRCATGSGCRLTDRTPLSRHTTSAFQILGVPRLHIS